MINRRNIRIKALQVIYSSDLASIKPGITEINKALKTKFTQTSALLNFCLYTLVEIAKYVEVYANQKASKHLPTAYDLAVNTKLAGNEVMWLLLENKSFSIACENTKTALLSDQELVKKLFLTLESTPEYKLYINNQSRTKEEDSGLMKFIWNDLMLANEEVVSVLTEKFQNFDDDIEMLNPIVLQALDKPKSVHFNKYMTADKESYANKLVETFYEKYEVINEYINPKLKNWDPERVAKLDMIILHMGVAELLFFETIPVKVTLNEYIDIAKEYSTPQSGQFVNGILDNIHKDLVKDNLLHKVDFKKWN